VHAAEDAMLYLDLRQRLGLVSDEHAAAAQMKLLANKVAAGMQPPPLFRGGICTKKGGICSVIERK
jgi:hypothetical protein